MRFRPAAALRPPSRPTPMPGTLTPGWPGIVAGAPRHPDQPRCPRVAPPPRLSGLSERSIASCRCRSIAARPTPSAGATGRLAAPPAIRCSTFACGRISSGGAPSHREGRARAVARSRCCRIIARTGRARGTPLIRRRRRPAPLPVAPARRTSLARPSQCAVGADAPRWRAHLPASPPSVSTFCRRAHAPTKRNGFNADAHVRSAGACRPAAASNDRSCPRARASRLFTVPTQIPAAPAIAS